MARLWRKSAGVIALMSLSSLLAGCGFASAHSAKPAAVANPKQLVVDLDAAPSNLDPGLQYNSESYFVYRNLFDQLLTDNPYTQKIQPDVATKWKSLSPTEWEFTIRRGIKFSNGRPLTPVDVQYSLQRILNPAFNSPQSANFSQVKSVRVQGDNVIITTTSPDPVLLGELTTLSIVPKAYILAHGNAYFNLHPVGSGPYKLKQWVQGSTVTMVANNHYWRGKPAIQSVEFRAVPSESTMVSDLQSGVADIAYPILPDQVSALKSAGRLKVETMPVDRVAYLAFNTDMGVTRSVYMREAIVHALNVPLMIKTLEDGYGKQVNSTLTPIGFGYDQKIPFFKYDPSLVKSLLKKAHYHGQPLVFATSPAYPQPVVQAMQQQLEAVGIRVSIDSTTQATYLEKVQSPKHQWGNIRMGAWQGTWPDASTYLYPMFYSKSIWSSWSNAAFNRDVTAAQSTLHTALRTKYLDQALTIMHGQAPAMGLWQEVDIYGVNKSVTWKPNPLENFFIYQMHWAN